MTEPTLEHIKDQELDELLYDRKGLGGVGAFWWGAVGGMVLFSSMFALCMIYRFGAPLPGPLAGSLKEALLDPARRQFLLYTGKVLLGYLAVGFALGGFFGLTGGSFHPKDARKGRLYCLLCGIIGAVTVQIAVLMYQIAETPSIYSSMFYEGSTILRSLQEVAISFLIPPLWKYILGFLVFAALWQMAKRIHPVWATGVLVALIAAGLFGYFWHQTKTIYPIPGDPDKPNLLILTSSGLKADRMNTYGHFRTNTPNINRLATEGFYLVDSYGTVARTAPSFATLLSGQYPQTHGVRHNYPSQEAARVQASIMSMLADKGYRTAGFTDSTSDAFTRLELGMQTVEGPAGIKGLKDRSALLSLQWMLLPYLDNPYGRELFPSLAGVRGFNDPKNLTNRVLEFVSKETETPFAVTVVYSTTQMPVSPRYPYYEKYTSDKYDGTYKYRQPLDIPRKELLNTEVLRVQEVYDGAVAAFDREAGRIFRFLADRGALNNTLVLVTSDYGASLYERPDDLKAGDYLWGEAGLHLPMVFRWPENAGPVGEERPKGQIKGLVSQVDVAPTLLRAFDLESSIPLDGTDMTDFLLGNKESVREFAFAETGIWPVPAASAEMFELRINYPTLQAISKPDQETGRVYIDEDFADIVEVAKHRAAFDLEGKVIAMPTTRGMHYGCYPTFHNSLMNQDLFETQPEVCLKYKTAFDNWLSSSPAEDVVNGFALPSE